MIDSSRRLILALGSATLLGLVASVATSPRTSLYLLGIVPVVLVLVAIAVSLRARTAKAGGIYLVVPAVLFSLSVGIIMYQSSAGRLTEELSSVRRSLLPRREIQIGQPLPFLQRDERLKIVDTEEDRLSTAQSLLLVTKPDPYEEAGVLSILARDYSKAGSFLTAAQGLGQASPLVTNNLGVAYYYGGLDEKAARQFEQAALELNHADPSTLTPDMEAVVYNNLGVALRDKGNLAEALEKFQTALAKSKSEEVGLIAKLQMAAVYRIQEKHENALMIAEEVLASKNPSEYLVAFALNVKGLVAEDKKEFKKAREYYAEAAARYEKAGYLQNQAIALNNLGNAYINDPADRDSEEGRNYLQRALAINQELGLEVEQALNHANLAYAYYKKGNLKRAASEANIALTIDRRTNRPLEQAAVLDTIGLIYQREGKLKEARSSFEESLQLARRTGHRLGEAEVLKHFANLTASAGDYKLAKALALEAQAIYEQGGDAESAGEVEKMYRPWEVVAARQRSKTLN